MRRLELGENPWHEAEQRQRHSLTLRAASDPGEDVAEKRGVGEIRGFEGRRGQQSGERAGVRGAMAVLHFLFEPEGERELERGKRRQEKKRRETGAAEGRPGR